MSALRSELGGGEEVSGAEGCVAEYLLCCAGEVPVSAATHMVRCFRVWPLRPSTLFGCVGNGFHKPGAGHTSGCVGNGFHKPGVGHTSGCVGSGFHKPGSSVVTAEESARPPKKLHHVHAFVSSHRCLNHKTNQSGQSPVWCEDLMMLAIPG